MSQKSLFKNPHFFPAQITVILSLVTSAPFFLERFGSLSGTVLGAISAWEVIVAFYFPLTGIIGSAYGWLRRDKLWAFLIGMVPYVPHVFLGIPLVLITGLPMGLLGAGVALVKGGNRFGAALIAIGVIWWGYLGPASFNPR